MAPTSPWTTPCTTQDHSTAQGPKNVRDVHTGPRDPSPLQAGLTAADIGWEHCSVRKLVEGSMSRLTPWPHHSKQHQSIYIDLCL